MIVSVDGVPIHDLPLVNLYGANWIGGAFLGRAGERVAVRVLRDAQEWEVSLALGTRDEVRFRIESLPSPSAEQRTVRAAWLKR